MFTTADVPSDVSLVQFLGQLSTEPSGYSLQIGVRLHLHGTVEPEEYINHACAPSCRIDIPTLTLKTIRPLRPGDELTFNYLSTEWDFHAPFQCRCGSPECFGFIRGYRYLSAAARLRIAHLTAPFLRELSKQGPGEPADLPRSLRRE